MNNTKIKHRIAKIKRKTAKRIKRWARLPDFRTENKCFFRAWVVERYGEENACKNEECEYNKCPQACQWIPACPHCGKDCVKHVGDRMNTTDGEVIIWLVSCINPECPSRTKERKEAPVGRGKPDYYV